MRNITMMELKMLIRYCEDYKKWDLARKYIAEAEKLEAYMNRD